MDNFHSDSDERRYLPRWEARNRVLYQLSNSSRINESVTRDINATGASFVSRQTLEPKQTVKLTIYLSPNVTITVQGHITWSKAVKKDENLLGVEFENVDPRIQEKILEHAFELDDKNLLRSWYQKSMKTGKKKLVAV